MYYIKIGNRFLSFLICLAFGCYVYSFEFAYASNITPYIFLASKMANKRKITIEGNNLHNSQSTGFQKHKNLTITVRQKKCSVFMPLVSATYIDLQSGGAKITSRKLDIAIQGYGYFKVLTPNGAYYTLDGAMEINQDGILVNSSGYPFLDEREREINIAPNFSDITFTSKGDIFVTIQGVNTNIAKLSVVIPQNPLTLIKAGNNLTINTGEETQAQNYCILQGSLNLSNVNLHKSASNIRSGIQEYKKFDNLMNKIFNINEKEANKLSGLIH